MLFGAPVSINEDWPSHQHEAHELIVCGSENAWLGVSGEKIPFYPGRTFLLQAGVSHYFGVNQGKTASAHLICFDDAQIDKYSPVSIQPLRKELFAGGFSIGVEQNTQTAEILQTAISLNLASTQSGPYKREIAGSLFSQLLFHHLAALKSDLLSPANRHNEKMNKAIQWIDAHITEEITIDIAASHANMSRAAFTKHFRKHTSMSLTEYVSYSRIQKSVSYLADASASITEIAFRSGYRNIGHFYKHFQKNFSMTPNQFRQMLLSQSNRG